MWSRRYDGNQPANSAPRSPLRGSELVAATAAVVSVYGSGLCLLHQRASAGPARAAEGDVNYWGTLPSAWDHPEPNYLVSPAIGEFWSVLTTIPVAGVLLLYVGLKYSYGWKVLRIYFLTCAMYTFAFSSHLTLQKHVFSTTVTAVMSNALLTFAQFSGVVHKTLKSAWVRGFVVFVAELALVGTVATLPYALESNGGVWTLFVVQSPGVFLATAIASVLASRAQTKEELTTYRTVRLAGCFLSSAMVLSFFECMYGFEYGCVDQLWGFPWLHIAIHVFEQVGIYIFGVGVAALHELLFLPQPRAGAEMRYACFGLPYLYCPSAAGEPVSGPQWCPAADEPVSAPPVCPEAEPAAAAEPKVEDMPQTAGVRGRSTELHLITSAANGDGADETNGTPSPTAGLNRRRRDKTPGTLPVVPAPPPSFAQPAVQTRPKAKAKASGAGRR